MKAVRSTSLFVAALSMASISGCEPEPTGSALTQLPGPYYLDFVARLASSGDAGQAGSTPPMQEESWLPPGGISGNWRYIVLHHSASEVGSLARIDRWHRDKGWDGCGYHFVIGNGTDTPDGWVEVSPRWKAQGVGAHTRLSAASARKAGLEPSHYNNLGIGVVLVGNYDKTAPTEKQMQSLARLLKYLMAACDIPESRVLTHGSVDQTRCPGRHFSRAEALTLARSTPSAP